MKFVTFAALALTTDAKSGALNYLWTDGMVCPDFSDPANSVETLLAGGGNQTFNGFKQTCAEAAYGLDSEYAPCI